MASCPKCDSSLGEQDFGLIVCPQCGASVFIDMDGKVSSESDEVEASSETSQEVPPEEADLETPEGFDFNTQVRQGIGNPESEVSEADRMLAEGGSTASGYLQWDQEFEETEEEAQQSEQEYNAVPEMDPNDKTEVVSDSLSQIEHPFDGDYEYASDMGKDQPSINDIVDFANSSNTAVEPLRYKIELSGIDSIEVRKELKSALTDRRFMWDVDQLMKSVDEGRLVIEEVSPVKAYILVSRILSLPVEIKWEQQAVANA